MTWKFFSSMDGIGGKIKSVAEDFIVEEIPLSLFPPRQKGKFTIATVTAKNWETNGLINELAKNLGISRRKIGFAGTKDKKAITTQLMSFPVPLEKVEKINIRRVKIENCYRSDQPIRIGDLEGNRFTIIIREISLSRDEIEKRIKKVVDEILLMKGFPNFFGVQRFGTSRPITHLVGKFIVKGEMEKAVMCYMANPIEGEGNEAYKTREFLEESMDFDKALKIYPRYLSFERTMISHLARKQGDWIGALHRLPKNLLLMFIHAYQSYLFNEILSERLEHLPITKAVVGDIVIPSRKRVETESRKGILVEKRNLDKVNRQIEKGNAFVSGIIFGYESRFAKGKMGEIERRIIEREGLSKKDFIISKIPELSCKGLRRILLTPLNEIKWEFLDEKSLKLEFELPKGCYATSLLREFMKDDMN